MPGGPSGQVSVRILRAQGTRRPLPVILYLHGAGWVFGNHHTHDRLIRELAIYAQAAVVFPDYCRSPEAKYPTAIEECYAVAQWIAAQGRERDWTSAASRLPATASAGTWAPRWPFRQAARQSPVPPAGAVLPGHRCQLRYRVLP